MLLLEQKTTRKGWVDKKIIELEFETGNSEEYKVEEIWKSAVYANRAERHLPGLYYPVAWKRYLKKEKTWKLLSAVQHLKKLINSFYKELPEKPTAIFPPIDFTLLMARPTVKPTRPSTKRKRSRPANSANKQVRNWVLDACNI